MQDSDWKTTSIFCYILGGLLFLGYWYAYFYSYTISIAIPIYPYRDFSYILMSSVILLFLGYYFGQVSKGKASIFGGKEPITKTGYCSDCGTAKDSDALYCKKCGKSLA